MNVMRIVGTLVRNKKFFYNQELKYLSTGLIFDMGGFNIYINGHFTFLISCINKISMKYRRKYIISHNMSINTNYEI